MKTKGVTSINMQEKCERESMRDICLMNYRSCQNIIFWNLRQWMDIYVHIVQKQLWNKKYEKM